MEGFFDKSVISAQKPTLGLVPLCEICGLYKHCNSPKMPVTGEGKRKILILAEASGKEEDKQGLQFVGKAGQCLQKFTSKVGLNLRKDFWIVNSLRCHPKDEQGRNRKPTNKEINACRPALTRTLNELKPEIVIPLGKTAVQSLMGVVWKGERIGSILRWIGWKIPEQKYNMWICPNWHPSYLERQEDSVLDNNFEKVLKEAVDLEGRPNQECYQKKKVIKLFNIENTVQEIRNFIERGEIVSWDIETNMLKPDSEEAKIICCSIASPSRCISFLWEREIEDEMRNFLRSDLPKVGFNIKFESNWVRRKLGVRVRNWIYDGMIGTHVLDNRSAICSLKFQAFVNFGVPDYDSHIKSYFKSDGSNSLNKILHVDKNQLLEYCGIDSILELKLAIKQMKVLDFDY